VTDVEVANEVLRTADFLVMSGGGVTLSGGEPLAQADFASAVIDRIRALEPRLTHAVETSGFATSDDYRKVVSKADLVYQDLKFPDLDGYRRWTGVDATAVFENVEWLKSSQVPFIARIPCIPGVNDSRELKAAIVRLLDGSRNCRGVEFLPYNRLAGAKYAKLGRKYLPGFDERALPNSEPI
jgi:pyruvate formate lyase activating enzyme